AANFEGAPRPELPARFAEADGIAPILAGPFLGTPLGFGYGYGLPFGIGAPYYPGFAGPNTFVPGAAMYAPGYGLPGVLPPVYQPFGAVAPVGYGMGTGLGMGYGARGLEVDADRYAAIRADFTDPVDG